MTSRYTFRPHERLKKPADFRRVYDQRRSAADATLIVYAIENDMAFSRLGISVAKKRVRTATARNRLKRLIREAFRQNKSALPQGVDLVVVPRGARLTLAEVSSSLVNLARDAIRRLNPRSAPQPAPPPVSPP
jgi:ribonuclease P protein component